MSDLVDFKKVPTFYKGTPWQNRAMDYLNSLPDEYKREFTRLRRFGLSDLLKAIGLRVTHGLAEDLKRCFETYGITTKLLQAHFIAQMAHETGGGRWYLELASGDAYEGRKDLGNTQPGDGMKFKGAGALQMTGRYNYQRFANSIGDQDVMRLGATYVALEYPFTSAGFWWKYNDMNLRIVMNNASCRMVSAWVNGRDPANGLAEREAYFKKAMEVLP